MSAILSIYCDGSSHAKGGLPVGWAWVAVLGGEIIAERSGGAINGTNNTAELTAAIEGLKWAKFRDKFTHCLVELVSDSQLCLGIASGAYNPTKNLELAKELKALFGEIGWRTRWVKGHQKIVDDGSDSALSVRMNARCDMLAKEAKVKFITLAKTQTEEPV